MQKKGEVGGVRTWLRKRAGSFVDAGRGVKLVCWSQPNFRIHLLVGACVLAASWFFKLSAIEWLIVILTMSLVLATEAFNSALEKLIDLCQPQFHPLAKDAKDLAAGAVLIASAGALIIGLILFVPRLIRMLAG